MAAAIELRAQFPSDDIHRLISARDNQFDNASLSFVKAGTVYFNYTSNQDGKQIVSREEIPYRHKERIVVRNHELTHFSDVDDLSISAKDGSRFAEHSRWTNKDGHIVELIGEDLSGNVPGDLATINPESASVSGVAIKRWPIELTLGFGYARRMESGDFGMVEQSGELTKVQGKIGLTKQHTAECELLIDEDQIVRKAIIRSGNKFRWNVYSIETDGLLKSGDFACAESGSFKNILFLNLNNKLIETVEESFTLSDVDLQLALNNQQYHRLTNFEIPNGTQVIDQFDVHSTRVAKYVRKTWLYIGICMLSICLFIVLRRRLKMAE